MAKGKKTGGGSRKGKPNKSTIEIKEIVQSSVDFVALVKELEKRAKRSNDSAAKLLLEYGFGKPREVLELDTSTNATEVIKMFGEMVRDSGTGEAT